MTKTQFLAEYRAQLVGAGLAWTQDPTKLDTAMATVEQTIRTARATWIHDGPLARATWRAIGGKGKITLKGLRALPP